MNEKALALSEKAFLVYESLVNNANPKDGYARYYGNIIHSSDERSSIISELLRLGLIRDPDLYGHTYFSCYLCD